MKKGPIAFMLVTAALTYVGLSKVFPEGVESSGIQNVALQSNPNQLTAEKVTHLAAAIQQEQISSASRMKVAKSSRKNSKRVEIAEMRSSAAVSLGGLEGPLPNLAQADSDMPTTSAHHGPVDLRLVDQTVVLPEHEKMEVSSMMLLKKARASLSE